MSKSHASGPVGAGQQLVVQLSVADLRALVAETVAEVLADHEPAQAPALLDRQGLARALGVCVRTVATLQQQGCPTVMVCKSPRFELAAVLGWLRRETEQPGLRVVGGGR